MVVRLRNALGKSPPRRTLQLTMPARALASAVFLLLLATAPAGAVTRPLHPERHHEPLVDVRSGKATVPAAVRTARAKLLRSLGDEGVLSVDRVTGSVRWLGRTDGYLTGPSNGKPRDIALAWAREHLDVLGLTEADLRGLRLGSEYSAPNGVTRLIFRQTYRGVPALDSTLRVNVARDGRILNVGGRPRAGIRVPSVRPVLTATQAAFATAAAVGAERPSQALAQATARTAKLRIVAVDGKRARLAWRLWFEEHSTAAWSVVVDASTGALIRRTNQVKFAGKGLAWDYYPGAPRGGAAREVDFTRWLEGPDRLRGNFTHTYNDADNTEDCALVTCEDPNAHDVVTPNEEIRPQGITEGDWLYPYTPIPSPAGNCPEAGCTWNHAVNGSWVPNRDQDGTQVFFFVNNFAEHLKAPPISFDERANFQFKNTTAAGKGDDGIYSSAMDAAGVAGGRPVPVYYSDNANMLTRPDGIPSRMQMYLFEPIPGGAAGLDYPFSDVSGGGDGTVVYHEFTHGLSNRLVIDAEGEGALGAIQSGAMGEAWSDFYAMDFLIGQGFERDTPAPGEIKVGIFVDGGQSLVRTEPIDCRPGDPAEACPRKRGVSKDGGGYTYEEFGRIIPSGPQVHADGEIWSQTLMDLRRLLVADHGEAKGADRIRTYVTRGMELSVDEPSFIDMRNAILQADVLAGKKDHRRIWEVFAARGMGAGASAVDGKDTAPVAAFDLPPNLPASDRLGPAVTIDSPAEDAVVRTEGATFSGTAADDAGVTSFTVQGAPVALTGNGTWATTLQLPAGRQRVQVLASDIEDRAAAAGRTVLVDGAAPLLGKVLVKRRGKKRLVISGSARDDIGIASIKIGKKAVRIGSGGRFSLTVKRPKSRKARKRAKTTIVVTDRAGRTSKKKTVRLR
jgi:hypothetical protein